MTDASAPTPASCPASNNATMNMAMGGRGGPQPGECTAKRAEPLTTPLSEIRVFPRSNLTPCEGGPKEFRHGKHHPIRPDQRDGHAAPGDGSPVRGFVRQPA